MNATPMNPTSGNAVQSVPQAGKSADASTPDVPFSQVLSSEIAQTRKSEAPQASGDTDAKPDPAASRPAGSAEGKTDSRQPTQAGEKTERDHDKKGETDTAETATVAPETLLGLPISPDTFKPTVGPVGTKSAEGVVSETASDRGATAGPALGAPGVSAQDARKGRAIPFAQTMQQAAQHDARQAGSEHGTQKLDPRLASQEDMHAAGAARPAAPADAAAAFQGQLAAARHADAVKTGDIPSDLVGNPALRTTPHASIDTQFAPANVSSSRLAPSVGTAAWGQALGEKLVWMAAGTQQTASLTLNPPNLGPLQIVVQVTNDQATASFFSAQPEVRQALEAAFPRLRDMMNDAGIQLGQATVSADTPQQNSTPDRQAQRITLPFSSADHAAPAGLQAVQTPIRQSGRGLVDTFA